MTITRQLFEKQCKRRFGRTNPERMNVPVWEWMVRRGTNPYLARSDLGLEGHYGDNNPDWAFERFGMSRTVMPDGRMICIAGEHEDYYDPDFCIYNDVVVLRPGPGAAKWTPESGGVEIYGYPAAEFPPTDFHSATLVGDRIIVIGRLGYAGTRARGQTPVFSIDTATYRIQPVPTHGTPPGWIYRHHAWFDAETNSIVVRGGMIETGDTERETPNLSAYRLRLADATWELVAAKESHHRFLLKADDLRAAAGDPTQDTFRPRTVPYDALLPEDHGVPVYGISVRGVRITFEEFGAEVRMLIEGDLPPEMVSLMLEELRENLRRDTGSAWTVRPVEAWDDPDW